MEIKKFTTYCNTYVILSNTSAVVIDPFEFTDEIKELINRSGIEKKAVVLTHGHYDHIKDATKIRELTGAEILIHSGDAECLLHTQFTLCALFGEELAPFEPDKTFEDGDVLNLGDISLEVIHTPGHTKGSCCFKLGEILFTGDTLFNGSIGRTDFPRSDNYEMVNSLKKLKGLKGDYTVFAGHGEETSLEYERQRNVYLLGV